ncbi:hypothetical protein ACIQM0_22640 [Streptomyces sp. NPDC091387]|uniref:hypothetical protein n=1 Tax=Streptomyces sp. NPDC091387 TaxID=3365998 RepID=UPI003808C796
MAVSRWCAYERRSRTAASLLWGSSDAPVPRVVCQWLCAEDEEGAAVKPVENHQ